jgi:hypothetical protein
MLAEGGIAAAIGGEPRTPLQHSPYPCGEGRLAVGEVRMRDAGLERIPAVRAALPWAR